MTRTRSTRMLSGLLERQLIRRIRESSMEGEREFAFVHALARDVAYRQLPRAARARRHGAVAALARGEGGGPPRGPRRGPGAPLRDRARLGASRRRERTGGAVRGTLGALPDAGRRPCLQPRRARRRTVLHGGAGGAGRGRSRARPPRPEARRGGPLERAQRGGGDALGARGRGPAGDRRPALGRRRPGPSGASP